MVVAGLLHPENIVEKQAVAVGGRQSLVRQSRCVDDDLVQFAYLGLCAQCHSNAPMLRLAMIKTVGINSSGAMSRSHLS